MAQKETFILDFRADTSNVQSQFNQLKTAMMDLASRRFDNTSKMSADLRKASEEAMKMGAALKNAVNPTTGKLDLSRLNLQMKNLGISAASLQKSMFAAGDTGKLSFMKIANAVANAEAPIIRTNALLDKMWMTMQNTARWQVSSMALNALVSGFQNSFTFAKDLNKNLNDIRIVSGDSAAEMERYAREANKAAKAIGTTTNEMVEATVIYRQQGDNLETAAKKAEITAKMANVSLGVSAQEMSEYLTGIWNSYQVGSDQLELFADKLARVGAVTASNAGELATAMTKVAATANTVGVNYDQLLATISTVSSATRQSEESIGTAFKTIYARMGDLKMNGFIDEDGLTTTLGDVSKQLKQAGFDILDGDNMIKDMGSVIEEIGNQWDDLSRNIQTSLAQAMGGKRQYTQIFALFENWDKYKQTLQESTAAQGELNEQQKIYLDSWEAASQRTKAIKEDMVMDFIDDDGIIALINVFNGFLTVLDDVSEGMGGFTGALGMLMGFIVNKFSKQIGQSFQSLRANTMIFFGQGGKLAEEELSQWTNSMNKFRSQLKPGTLEDSEAGVIEAKLNAQHKMSQLGDKLSDSEKEILTYYLQQLDVLRQQGIEKEKQEQQRQQNIMDDILGGRSFEDLDPESDEAKRYQAAQERQYQSRERVKKINKEYEENVKNLTENVENPKVDEERIAKLQKKKEIEKEITAELEKQKNLSAKRDGALKDTKSADYKYNLRKKQYEEQPSNTKKKSMEHAYGQTYQKDIDASAAKVAALKEELEGLNVIEHELSASKLKTGQIFSGITQGLAGLSMALGAFQGVKRVFEEGFDPSDINDWVSVVMSVSTALMGLNMLMQAGTTLKLKDSWATGIQAGTIARKGIFVKGDTVLTKENTTVTEMNTVAKIANFAATHPIATALIVAGAAIIGVTAAIVYNTDALRQGTKEYKRLDEQIKTTTELLDKEKQALEEKKKKLEEIKDLNSDEAKNLQKSIAIQERYVETLTEREKAEKQLRAQQAKLNIEEKDRRSDGNYMQSDANYINSKLNERKDILSGNKIDEAQFAQALTDRIINNYAGSNIQLKTADGRIINYNAALGGSNLIKEIVKNGGQLTAYTHFDTREISYSDLLNNSDMSNSALNMSKEQIDKIVEDNQNRRESDDYKNYVEWINALEESAFKNQKLKELTDWDMADTRAKQYQAVYDQAKEIDDVTKRSDFVKKQIEDIDKKWETTNNYLDRKSEIMMRYGSTVEGVTKNIDDLQSATNAMNKAITEYNKNGSISLDTFQSLLSLKPSYLSALQIENGQMKLNSDQLQTSVELQKENLIMQQLNATISQILTMVETDMGSALAYLTGMTDEHTKALEVSTQELIENTLEKLENDGATKEQIDGFRAGFEKLKDTYLGLKDISLSMEASAEDVRKAAKSLKEAEDDLANFYLKKKLDANKREIEKFAKSIEDIESAMSFANFADKDSIGAMKEKMSIMREQLAATQVEFDNLANTIPNSDKEAEELFSRMEEYGDSIKDLTLNIKEAEIELDNLKWTVAADAFEEQLEQMSKLSEVMDDLKNSYGVNGSEALRQNALRRMLYSGTSANKNASIYERNKGEYEKYLAMTKDIDEKVNKAHEKALELSYKKEEENLKDKVKEAKSSYAEITRIHNQSVEDQKKKVEEQTIHYQEEMDKIVGITEDTSAKIGKIWTGVLPINPDVFPFADTKMLSNTEGNKRSFINEYNTIYRNVNKNVPTNKQISFLNGEQVYNRLGQAGLANPVDVSNILSNNHDTFEYRNDENGERIHRGEDYNASSVYVAENGKVLYAPTSISDTAGKWIVLKGNSGVLYSYMHLDQIDLKQGQDVTAGQYLGLAGNTGRSNGVHLHIEGYMLSKDRRIIDDPSLNDFLAAEQGQLTKHYIGIGALYKALNGGKISDLKTPRYKSAFTGNEYPNGVDKVTVGEKGEELVVYGDGSGSVLISEPQILTDLPPGSIVYSAEETKAIKERSKNSATNMINNGTRGLGAIQNAHKAQLRKFGSSLSAEDSYFLTKSFTNDSLWEVRKILSEVENLIDSIGFSLLSKEDQDNIYALHDTIAEKESELIEEYENAAKNYWEQRFELADNYFKKMDEFMRWDESEDSRITGTLRMYEDILKQGIIEAKDFEAFNQAMTNRLKEAVEGDLDYLDGYAKALTSNLEDVNEELEKSVARLDSIYNLTEKHFDIVNKLSDAEHEANKNLYMAMNSARWLDESTRELLYNTKDYAKVTAKISEIREDEEELFLQYQTDINNLSEDELWRAEFITAEYEKQVKLKEEELELLSAELDLTKKRQALTNTLMEKNVRVYTGGRWVYMPNQKDVEAATQDYLEAQYKYDQQVTKIEQQKVLNEIDAERTALNTQIGENEGEVKKIQKLVEDTRKVWEEHIAKLTYGDLSLQGLGDAVETTVKNINTAMSKMDYLTSEHVVVDANYQATQKEIDDAVLGIIGMKKIWSETGSLTESQQADLKKYRESLTKASNGEFLTKYYSADSNSYEDIVGDLIANQNNQLWKKARRLENVDLSTILGGIFDLENVDVEKVQQNAKEFIGVFSEDEVAQLNENVEISGKEFSNFASTLATSNKVIGDAFMNIVKATNVGQGEIKNWTEEGKAELTELLNRYLELVRSMMSANSSSSSSSKSSKSNSSNEGKSASKKAKEASDIIQGGLPKKVQNLLNRRAGSKLKTQKNAAGTRSSSAGWSMVNERGVEMYANKDGQFIELNPYEKIFNNEQFEFLYDLSKAGTSGVSSIMKNYSTKNSTLSIGAMTIELPNVTDTDSFAEGLKGLNDYIRSTKTINH